ncbi:YitT family protein [Alteromonas ponticola]|uniref:YitT family protein n=1 Tax=Alteromonas ponticola TaxID=2720613 RepID=A0ABX1R224_9ALTE|nr:YitT family protein [Alteromonas ponticola]NMH60144.1 YitT family protein [Alteromonas ponticola]
MKHSLLEDFFALLCAGLFVSFGLVLFQAQQLMVGGAAGLALLGTFAIDLEFGWLFFLINLPFYLLSWTKISKRFTINTLITVTTISILSESLPGVVNIAHVNPLFAAIFGGVLIGVGMLIMFRHSSSLGGIGILGYYLQQRWGLKAGVLQFCVDSVILSCALFVISWPLVVISVLAAICLNLVISLNHRPERYHPERFHAGHVHVVEKAVDTLPLPHSQPHSS